MRKRSIVMVLVGVNLFLLAALVYSVFPMPAAYGQRVGTAGNFMLVTGEIQSGYDAVYLFDVGERVVYAFTIPKGRSGEIVFQDKRDLKADFRE